MMDDDDDDLTVDDFPPDELGVEVINAYHIGQQKLTATIEVSDFDEDAVRSFFVEIDFEGTPSFEILTQIEDSFLGHLSRGLKEHYLMELGGIIHHLQAQKTLLQNVPKISVRAITGTGNNGAVIVGEDGANYLLDGQNWRLIEGLDTAIFRSVHSAKNGLVFATGNDGVVARLKSLAWDPINLPTNDDFNAIWAASADSIYLAGNQGLCIHLIESEMIELEADPFDYFGICEFQGNRYWSSAQYGISIQNDERVEKFKELTEAFTMQASDAYLVVTGWKTVFVFDGNIWRGFEFGYNEGLFMKDIPIN